MTKQRKDELALILKCIDADDHVLLLDHEYTIRYASLAAIAGMHMYTPEAMIGCSVFDLIKCASAEKLRKKLDKARIKGEKKKLKDVRILTPVGQSLDLDVKMKPIVYNDQPSVKLTLKA